MFESRNLSRDKFIREILLEDSRSLSSRNLSRDNFSRKILVVGILVGIILVGSLSQGILLGVANPPRESALRSHRHEV